MLRTFPQPNTQVIATLSALRQEWQQAAQGTSLLEMEANVGLMLADLVNSLGLSIDEQALVLGSDLYLEIQTALSGGTMQ
jgi:hypothetical protein